ncbi:hypothetical protein D1BOALGB6SA_9419 [Olavius sp. associated proteobacterium Delta 1]|nr:hypothetical protein D1BOALGB6SA_9419 [Olavius sp. associated proteobacterium Delta 1]
MPKIPKLPKTKDVNHYLKKIQTRFLDPVRLISQVSVFSTATDT